MTDAPWEVIRRAADKVEELASLAVIGPWSAVYATVWAANREHFPNEDYAVASCCTGTTAAWIATMSPAVAEPLVAWLNAVADRWVVWPWPGVMPKPDVDSDGPVMLLVPEEPT